MQRAAAGRRLEPRPRAVKPPVAQHQAFDFGSTEHRLLERAHATGRRCAGPTFAGRERIGLGVRLRALRAGEGDALGDEPARTRGYGGSDKIGGAFDAQPSVARQHLFPATGIERAGKVGQLMDDDFRLCPNDGIAQCAAVEDIHDDRRYSARSQFRLLGARARRAGHGMPVRDEHE
jgi:hypothetical protein